MRGALLATVLLAACSPSVNSVNPDSEVINAILLHFAQRDDATFPNEQGLLLVQRDSDAWTKEYLRSFGILTARNACQPLLEPMEALVNRNTTSVPLRTRAPPNGSWQFIDPEDMPESVHDIPLRTPDGVPVKTIASISIPVFSKDGNEAFALLSFNWSVHTAIAEYVVRRTSAGEWTVKCSELRFYP